MSYILNHVNNDGLTQTIEFDDRSEAERFDASMERFFLNMGHYPTDLHAFFVEHGFNPISINDTNWREPNMRRTTDRYGNSFIDSSQVGQASEKARVIDQEQRRARAQAANTLAVQNPGQVIMDVLAQTGALPSDKPLNQMSRAEQAQATAVGLAQLVQVAAAQMAQAKAEEEARGVEPPAGASVRLAKHFGGPDSKQYNYVAIRVPKDPDGPNAHREWHHSGAIDGVRNGLPNPCSWEELNDFADKGSVEVGVRWVDAPDLAEWRESNGGDVETDQDAPESDGSVNEQIVSVLHAGVRDAQRVLNPIAHPGAVPTKRDVKAALKHLDGALNAHDELLVDAEAQADKA